MLFDCFSLFLPCQMLEAFISPDGSLSGSCQSLDRSVDR